MRWAGRPRRTTPQADQNSEALVRLRAGSALAEQAGREGRTGEAARRYRELAAEAAATLGPGDPTALALRHQLAHWTGESGEAEAAVTLFAHLLADRERHQGPHHPDTELARHQLAHWHGRAGRCHEAVRRYREMYRAAEREGRTETALSLLCDMGHWQQEGGDTAAALRTFTLMLRTAERELGPAHQLTGIARRRYAELAGDLPFGHERGHDGLRDLVAAATEVEESGDFRRAGRMYGQIAEKCERLYGMASIQTLNARVLQARAAVKAEDFREASVLFQKVLDCMALLGQGPGSPGYDALCVQRDELARMARQAVSRIGEEAGTAVAGRPEAGPAPARRPRDRMPFNPRAEAIGDWRKVRRARAVRATDDPPRFGPYEVLERVGEGGFGRVYLCQDADGILVAVKTLHARHAAVPRIRRGFAHEVQAARRVSGRFTVPVIAADTSGETPWMAVPYVAAPSLQEVIERCGPLDAATVRGLGAGIATALTAIHAQGIVHLDLKPANVLLTEDGPRVIDFGIAQIRHLTEPRRGFAGTPAYASPEQLEARGHFTPASDVFSLGTLLARLALGRSPWEGGRRSVVDNIRAGAPDLAGLPAGLEAVVRRCLRRDPAERPAPEEVAAALVPGAAEERIDRPPLPEEARSLIREHATLAATRRYETGEGTP